MKAFFVILSALMLCSCGDAREKKLKQLEQAAEAARNEVTGIEYEIHKTPPGAARDAQTMRLKIAKTKAAEAKEALNKARAE